MRLRSPLQNLLLAVVSIIIFFAVAEMTTRLLWNYKAECLHEGVIIKQGNKQVVHDEITYATNSIGLRERELDKRPRREKVILVLGDSFVFGDGLSVENCITTKLENKLNELGNSVEVINGSGAGGNAAGELRELLRLTPIYKPSEVIVFFFTNDILEEEDTKNEATPATPTSWRQNIKEFLRARSHFFAFLYYLYKDRVVNIIGVPKAMLAPDYFDLDDTKPGWRSFKNSVLKMQSFCGERNILFRYVIIPTLTCLNDKYPYKEMHESLKNFFSNSGIEYLDLFPVFTPYSHRPSRLWVNLENSHWNGLATTLAADAVVKWKADLGQGHKGKGTGITK